MGTRRHAHVMGEANAGVEEAVGAISLGAIGLGAISLGGVGGEGAAAFGRVPVGFSEIKHGDELVRMADIDAEADVGRRVVVRARLHAVRGTAKSAFLVLRQQHLYMQAVMFAGETVSKDMIKFANTISRESIVDVGGTLAASVVKSDMITFKTIELVVDFMCVVSASSERLPFQVDDAARAEEAPAGEAEGGNVLPRVNLDTKLNNRVVDLRTPSNQALFRMQSGVMSIARAFLEENGFMEIHTPKLISAASEGGANVFKVTYFKTSAYLAQSPQFYKQMAICADFDRVYEVGPVFRAENSFTHRHMTEFTGFDFEMAFKRDYHEALYMLARMMNSIFRELPARFGREIAAVRAQYASEDFLFLDDAKGEGPLVLKFWEGMALLREAGIDIGDGMGDLSTEHERILGRIVRERYRTDFYILDKYPLAVRPFYTMPDYENVGYSNSYDVFMRGEEIMSGAQRVHDAALLEERATALGIGLDTIASYIDAFRYGVPPHAGGGIGLERILMLYLDVKNIRKTSLFPRDPHRITP